jgi:NADH-quinone oxidoreductase subunit I
MQLTNRSKVVSKKEMTLAERMYLPAIFSGMFITFSHFFRKKPTIKYPEQKREFSGVFRGQHVLKRDENGAERCTACGLCAVACPAEAITMVAAERKPGEEKLYREEKYAATYEINMLRCIFCGDCEEACPKEAIFLTDRKVDTMYNRKSLVFGKDILVESPENPIDLSKRQTPAVKEFKQHKEYQHNQTYDQNTKTERKPENPRPVQKKKLGHS